MLYFVKEILPLKGGVTIRYPIQAKDLKDYKYIDK